MREWKWFFNWAYPEIRDGEKLFEELTYNSNLIGTVHPRINTTFEKSMNSDELQSLLRVIQDAIQDNDYKKLFKNIAKVSPSVLCVLKFRKKWHQCDHFGTRFAEIKKTSQANSRGDFESVRVPSYQPLTIFPEDISQSLRQHNNEGG